MAHTQVDQTITITVEMPTDSHSRPAIPTRARVAERYAAHAGPDVSELHRCRGFAAWKTAIVLQQLHARWLRGESNDPRMAGHGRTVTVHLRQADRALRRVPD